MSPDPSRPDRPAAAPRSPLRTREFGSAALRACVTVAVVLLFEVTPWVMLAATVLSMLLFEGLPKLALRALG